MPLSESASFDGALRTRTIRYLDAIEGCVDALPVLIDAYDGGDSVAEQTAEIRRLESDCDRVARQIGALIANADVTDLGLRLTRVHLHSGRTIGLFHRLDEIPNTVEQVAEELDTSRPDPAPEVLAILHEMAAIAADAVLTLRNAVIGYVDMLCESAESHSIAADVHEIRAL